MRITCKNFGKFENFSVYLESTTAPNGSGKTTIVNAYIFALTGKTLAGFHVPRIGSDEQTEVIVKDFPRCDDVIRRMYDNGVTSLILNSRILNQSQFETAMEEIGIPVDLCAACADVNVLTDPSLTPDALRKILVRALVLDNGEADELRSKIKEMRASRARIEAYALTTVAVPAQTAEAPTRAEIDFLRRFAEASNIVTTGVQYECPTCKRANTASEIEKQKIAYDQAAKDVRDMRDEVRRIQRKQDAWETEQEAIKDAQRQIERASEARKEVQLADAYIAKMDAELRRLDAQAVRADLPEGVEIVTTKTTKSGKDKGTCTLTYEGVPLKSVNRAKRVEICVRMLDKARQQIGKRDWIPIIVDNAESVQGLHDIPNVVRFEVG